MSLYQIKIKLLSDTTFGRGDGVAGLIDQEVEHDPYGFPYLRGRTLKGLLSEECDNLVAVLADDVRQHWERVACGLFGNPGSTIGTMGSVHVGDACLPDDLRQAVAFQVQDENEKLTKTEVLNSLTTIRRQTAIEPDGTADEGSLRSFRVVLRQLDFTADLNFEAERIEVDGDLVDIDKMLSLLAVGTLALRYLGSGRNRGRGHVQCKLCNDQGQEITERYFGYFGKAKEVSA